MDLETFRAERRDQLDNLAELIKPAIEADLDQDDPVGSLENTLIAAYTVAHEESLGFAPPTDQLADFMADMNSALMRLEVSDESRDAQVDRLALWFSTAVAGHQAMNMGGVRKTWITMLDEKVRDTHDDLHGTTVDMGAFFTVRSTPPAQMSYPGQPVGPPEAWINCRCVLAIDTPNLVAAAEVDDDDPPAPDELIDAEDSDMPVHGILAPIGVESGDGRSFSSLTWRDLPLPLKWQRQGLPEHQGDVVVGRIDNIIEEGNLLKWDGVLIEDVPETEEVILLTAQTALRGVSVEADQAVATALDEEQGKVTFDARITGATIVATPAFPEAFIQLGTAPWLNEADDDASDEVENDDDELKDDVGFPIDNETLGASTLNFKRGSGWITHPEETKTLHSYWTKGKGAAKIRWGVSGDFTRCTRQLRKYITPAFLNRTCAEWHHDALGYWPGELGKPGNAPKNTQASGEPDMDTAPELTLTAAAPRAEYPASWFENPQLDKPTPMTIEKSGRAYGHLATWGVCHIGIDRECVEAPQSVTNYAYFHRGSVATDQGTVRTGAITMNTGHAELNLDFSGTVSHYDHTGAGVLDVVVGEDATGIWFSGAVREGCTAEQLRVLQAAGAVSGDWRSIGGSLELVAALAVNVPGFPIPQTALAASAERDDAMIGYNVVAAHDNNLDVERFADAVVASLARRESNKKTVAAAKEISAEVAAERRAKVLAALD